MGMGYGANMARTVSGMFIEKMCPREWRKFTGAVDNETDGLDDFAQRYSIEEAAECPETMLALKDLTEAFCIATTVNGEGLTLDLAYHDHEEGDRYDDVSGAYWAVGNAVQATAPGEKYSQHIRSSFFVTFG